MLKLKGLRQGHQDLRRKVIASQGARINDAEVVWKPTKHKVAPAELESFLVNHLNILDTIVTLVEDGEAKQIPIVYVVKVPGSQLTEDQVIQFVASQIIPTVNSIVQSRIPNATLVG